MVLFLLSSLIICAIAQDDNCRDNYGSNCYSNTTKCEPYTVSMEKRCEFVKCCCADQLEDPLLDYLNFQYCFKWRDSNFITPEIANAILLIVLAIYYFIILGNIADDYFAIIMADTADTLHVSHNIAGVTFLALGNGAPDISSSVAAIQQGGEQTKLGLGALLGAAVFDPILVSAVIATYAVRKPPEIPRRPFVRDCIFLFSAATFVLVITINGTVNMGEAISMVILYIIYVISAILTEIYKKMKQKQKKLKVTDQRKNSLRDKVIMPALGLFSNESMREIPSLGTFDESGNESSFKTTDLDQSFGGGTYQSFGFNQQMSTTGSIVRMGTSPNIEKQNSFSLTDDADSDSDSDSMERMSDILSSLLSEKSERNEKNRHWSLKTLIFVLDIPTKIVYYLCKITIPLTDDEHWNDHIALISCIIAPVWILFGFNILREQIGMFKLWPIALIIGAAMSLCTFVFVRQKYNKKKRGDTLTRELTDEDMQSDISSQMELTYTATKPKLSASMIYSKTEKEVNKGRRRAISEKNEKKIKPQQQPVMKYFFLLLGFLSSVAWINLAANEVVNILTTLGIVSNIDLAILGLTVLAWGNSIGDLVADVGVSKKGYPKMGIAAAIGGPTLNVLIGVGLATTIICIKDGSADLPISENIFYGCLGVMIGITIYCVTVALSSWRLNKYFGYFLYIYYIMFLVINVLAYQFPHIFFDFGL